MSAAIHYLSERKTMKIGIYGGSFDPVTYGHMLTAQLVAGELNLDIVMFEPVGDCYEYKHKKPKASCVDRSIMLTDACKDNIPEFFVGRFDAMSTKMNTSYELMRLYELRDRENNESNDYYFICGSDVLASIPTWENGAMLVKAFKIAVIERNTHEVYPIIEANEILREHRHSISVVRPDMYTDISSSAVRKRVAEGKAIKYFTPDSVCKYIEKNKLYQ